jgi:hypothetical protein
MSENLEAEKNEEATKEKIKEIVRGKLMYEGGLEFQPYFSPENIADGILRAPGRDIAEQVRNYFRAEWSMSRIDELPGDLWQSAKDITHDLEKEIIEGLK